MANPIQLHPLLQAGMSLPLSPEEITQNSQFQDPRVLAILGSMAQKEAAKQKRISDFFASTTDPRISRDSEQPTPQGANRISELLRSADSELDTSFLGTGQTEQPPVIGMPTAEDPTDEDIPIPGISQTEIEGAASEAMNTGDLTQYSSSEQEEESKGGVPWKKLLAIAGGTGLAAAVGGKDFRRGLASGLTQIGPNMARAREVSDQMEFRRKQAAEMQTYRDERAKAQDAQNNAIMKLEHLKLGAGARKEANAKALSDDKRFQENYQTESKVIRDSDAIQNVNKVNRQYAILAGIVRPYLNDLRAGKAPEVSGTRQVGLLTALQRMIDDAVVRKDDVEIQTAAQSLKQRLQNHHDSLSRGALFGGELAQEMFNMATDLAKMVNQDAGESVTSAVSQLGTTEVYSPKLYEALGKTQFFKPYEFALNSQEQMEANDNRIADIDKKLQSK